jgi:hypothetical protein
MRLRHQEEYTVDEALVALAPAPTLISLEPAPTEPEPRSVTAPALVQTKYDGYLRLRLQKIVVQYTLYSINQ